MFTKKVKVLGAVAATAATVGLVANTAISQERTLIAIDGSSTVFPITEAVAEEFMGTQSGVNVTVGVSGTGGGFKKFCAGETAISNASRPIKDSEKELCAANNVNWVKLDVAFDAITVVIHPENDWATQMTTEQLATLWGPDAEGTITRWNQIDSSWPNQPISLYGPGTDSGTFDYFTDEINGDGGVSRADYTASEDDNTLVTGVSGDKYAMGYFGMAYYLENDDILQAVAIDDGEGDEGFVTPSPATIEDYEPLARKIYIYVNTAALGSSTGPTAVRSFVQYYLDNAGGVAGDVGYVALPNADYQASMVCLNNPAADTCESSL